VDGGVVDEKDGADVQLMGTRRIFLEKYRRRWAQRSLKLVMIRLWVYPTASSTLDTVNGEFGSSSQPGSSESCRNVSEISPKKSSGESTISEVAAARKLGLERAL